MTTSRILSAVLLLAVSMMMPLNFRAAEKPRTEKEKIQALINGLENLKDATFIRNDVEYKASEAISFLQAKWQAHEKEIKTAVDFIDKVASMSATSGKPYLIRIKGASDVKSGDYFKEELKKLEINKIGESERRLTMR